jgi:ribosome-associated translation inhibitor RaiA
MYVAVEQVISKMETQIKKYKAKLRDKKGVKKSPPKTRSFDVEAEEAGSE